MKKQNKTRENKVNLKWYGTCIAAWFLVVGIILFYTPTYIGIEGWLEKTITAVGWIAIIISFTGIFIELSNILRNDGFSYIGVSLVFFIPSLLLHFFQRESLFNETVIIIAKIIVILFLIIGSGLSLYGVSFFLEKTKIESTKEKTLNSDTGEIKKSYIDLISSIIIGTITLATAIIQLMSQIS